MEVEINDSQNISQDLEDLHKKNSPYSNPEPSTPQRASQIFGFLTRGKQSKPAEDLMLDRTLPDPPSCFSSPSDENAHDRSSDSHIMPMDTSTDFTFAPTRFSAIPMPLIEDTPRPQHRPTQFPLSAPPEVPDKRQNDIKVIMNGPTKVIVTSATPSTNHNGPRLLRGPRAPPRKNSTGSVSRRRSALVELSNSSPNDPFTSRPSRHRPQHRRSSSTSSVSSLSRKNSDRNADYHSGTMRKADFVSQHKENRLGLSVKTELPSTPLRSNTTTSRSLLRSVIQQSMFQPPVGMTPSPASSSAMSPIGQQMMMDVRQQRMKAREADRDKTAHRFASDRNMNRI
ncbi:hypothetical protein NLJ89_g8046 [Agrocybe chaxingu]|uniref:Uncharacterized protein n=1 Tax=Agrocybe chaxingu TaxID=84603 RepID=A0A9W8MSI3_9AGAR|nr:hypothetical protein NLJ89_g8046 [Agrocybe chaxingu]